MTPKVEKSDNTARAAEIVRSWQSEMLPSRMVAPTELNILIGRFEEALDAKDAEADLWCKRYDSLVDETNPLELKLKTAREALANAKLHFEAMGESTEENGAPSAAELIKYCDECNSECVEALRKIEERG